MLKAVGYIRVSTGKQVFGFSIDAQDEKLRAYAKRQNYVYLRHI